MRVSPLVRLRLPLTLAFLLGVTYGMARFIVADGGALTPTLLKWLLAAALAALGAVAVTLVRIFLDVAFLRRQGHEAPALLHAVVSIALYIAIAVVLASDVFDRGLTGAFATSAVASVVVGLALQETLGNFFAGLALQLEQPFRIGDVVRTQSMEGRVEAFNWRATTVRTVNDTRITIPNSSVAREPIEVFARQNLNRRIVVIPAPYSIAPRRVLGLVQEAVSAIPGLSDRQPPRVRLGQFNDSSVGYEVLYWVEDYLGVANLDAQIRERVWYVFARAGIDIPFPHMRLLYDTEHVKAAAVGGEDELDLFAVERERRLAEVPLFEPLTQEERSRLAARARPLIFGPGERLLRAGTMGESLMVVLRGRVSVRVPRPEGGTVRVAEEGPGDVLGEMSLLTGELRSADVWAIDEVEVLEVGKDAMREVLAANAALAERLSHDVSVRLAERSEAFAHATSTRPSDTTEVSLLRRIRQFFELG